MPLNADKLRAACDTYLNTINDYAVPSDVLDEAASEWGKAISASSPATIAIVATQLRQEQEDRQRQLFEAQVTGSESIPA